MTSPTKALEEAIWSYGEAHHRVQSIMDFRADHSEAELAYAREQQEIARVDLLAALSASEPVADEVYIAITRGEGYEDVHHEILADDFVHNAGGGFEWRYASPVAAKPGWLPIESAPKDGLWCLIATANGGVGEASYNSDFEEWRWGIEDEVVLYRATHWMPLPEAPQIASQEEEG